MKTLLAALLVFSSFSSSSSASEECDSAIFAAVQAAEKYSILFADVQTTLKITGKTRTTIIEDDSLTSAESIRKKLEILSTARVNAVDEAMKTCR